MAQFKNVAQCSNESVLPRPVCGKCGHTLTHKHWNNERGVQCCDPRKVEENFCPNCGEPVEYPCVEVPYSGS